MTNRKPDDSKGEKKEITVDEASYCPVDGEQFPSLYNTCPEHQVELIPEPPELEDK